MEGEKLAWMKEDQKNAYANGEVHTFIITHGPIVGHGGRGTHNELDGTDHDKPFVEWVNGEDSNYLEGRHVEAVFVGHTHLSGGYKNITVNNMDMDNFNLDTGDIPFDWSTVYIETTTACKNYP